MATSATGTPSTNRAYPKINTAVDPPDGKGVNAIVDAIDADVATLPSLGIIIALG